MEEIGLEDGSKRKDAEHQDGESICSEKVEKVDLHDEDSFEVISMSCNGSSRYSTSGDSDDEDVLVVSFNHSMNKSFPEVQLLSDLVKPNPSSITLISDSDMCDDKYIPPEVCLTTEISCENYYDNAISAPLSQVDETSSIFVMEEPSEKHEPVLNVEYTSPSVPSSQNIQDQHPPSQSPLEESGNVPDIYGESSGVVSNPAEVFKKPSTSTWAAYSDISTAAEESLNASSVMVSQEGNNSLSSPTKLHSIFVEQPKNCAQPSRSAFNKQPKKSDVVSQAGKKDSPTKMALGVTHLHKVLNTEGGLWQWLCPKNLIHQLIDKARASIDAMISTLDPQMGKSCMKPDFEIFIAAASDFESWPICKAFKRVFPEKVGSLSVPLGSVPTQPAGFESGLYCAERRIKFMREQKLVDKSKVIVATSPVLVEVTPLRWHHTTCLMIDDPKLGLTLHTFAQTVPVPNIYVNQLQLRTPSDYHLKHLGFNITIGRVISIMTGMPENDWQYSMTGTSYNKIVESAAVVLAGTYQRYLNGVSY